MDGSWADHSFGQIDYSKPFGTGLYTPPPVQQQQVIQSSSQPVAVRPPESNSNPSMSGMGIAPYVKDLMGGMSLGNVAGTAGANATGTGIDGLLATNGAYGTAGGATGGGSSAAMMNPYGWIGAGMLANSALYDKGHSSGREGAVLDPVSSSVDNIYRGLGLDHKTAAILSGSALMQAIPDSLGIKF